MKKKILATACMLTGCFSIGQLQWAMAQNKAIGFHSSNGNYWRMKTEKLVDGTIGKAQVIVRTADKRQTFQGWGTTFNELDYDAWGMLPENDRTLFVRRLFNPYGDLRLGVGRIPVGASDYACDWYSCDETEDNVEDFAMEHFTIERDLQKVIPSIKLALDENPDLYFWASPWSPPQWMKTNKHYSQRKTATNGGTFDVPPYDNDQFIDDPRYYNAYCLYFDKFIEAYRNEGINISALAYQNEAYSNTPYPGCSWKAATTGKFLADYLGPYMAEHQPDLTLIVGTMNTNRYDVFNTILSTPNIGKYCKQIGFQWEGGQQIAAVREAYPDYESVMTESECGSGTFDWGAASHTFQLCNHYLANGVTTYSYWNAILKDGGYSTWGWKQNALVQVSSATNTAKYCPEYYAYKHYTHFIPKGATILACDEANLVTTAQAPDGSVVVVVGNDKAEEKTLTVDIDGSTLVCSLDPNSFATYVVAPEKTLTKILADEARGMADIEQASLTDDQRSALQAAMEKGDYASLLHAVKGTSDNRELRNPSFMSGDEGWTVSNVANGGDFRAATVLGKSCYNNWSNNFTSLDIHQDLGGLEPGLYRVSAKSVCGEGNISDQHVYAETATHLVKSPVKADDVWSDDHWETQTTDTIYVGEDGVLRVGYASTSGGGTKGWFCVTDFELVRVGDLTSDFDLTENRKGNNGLDAAVQRYAQVVAQAEELLAQEGYEQTSRDRLREVMESQAVQLPQLTEAALVDDMTRLLKEEVELFVKANLKTYLTNTCDATFLVKNATITAGTIDGWLRDNCQAAGYSEHPSAVQSGEHDGYGISHWRASAITDSKLIYQTLAGLPQGRYRLEAYAAATVWNNNQGNANKVGVSLFAETDDKTVETEVTTAQYAKYAVDFDQKTTGDVTIGLRADEGNQNTWIFLSDVKLLYKGGLADGIVVSGREPATPAEMYDLQGRRVSKPTHGLYIVDKRKVVVR